MAQSAILLALIWNLAYSISSTSVKYTVTTSMLVMVYVGDNFEMLVTDSSHWESRQHVEKSRQHIDAAKNIL